MKLLFKNLFMRQVFPALVEPPIKAIVKAFLLLIKFIFSITFNLISILFFEFFWFQALPLIYAPYFHKLFYIYFYIFEQILH